MNIPSPIKMLAVVAINVILLQGCVGAAAVVVVAGTSVAVDERSISTQVDDQTIKYSAIAALAGDEAIDSQTNINIVSINGSVLLIGQAPNTYLRSLAVKKVSAVKGVIKVHNQIRIGNNISFTTSSNDAWLTSKVKTALFGIDTLDATNIKVITENGEVFLMGIITKTSADQAVEITRNISGVNRVFKAFEYL